MAEVLYDLAFLNRFRKTVGGPWVLVGVEPLTVASDDVLGSAGWFPGTEVGPRSVAIDVNIYEKLEALAAIHGVPKTYAM